MPTNTPNNGNVTVGQVNIATQKATVEAEYKALITGINSELGDVTSFVLGNVVFTRDGLLAKFQGRLDVAEKVKTARTALHLLVADERAVQAEIAPLRMQFKQFLMSRYGKNSPQLQKFGFTQAKKPQRTTMNKTKGVLTGLATRAARGTSGKKQRLKVKGQPPAIVVEPANGAAKQPPPAPPVAPPEPAGNPVAATPPAGKAPTTGGNS